MEKNAMSDQEQDFFQEQDGELESGTTDRLSMLHLSTCATLHHHSTTGIPPITTSVSGDLLEKCASCGGGGSGSAKPQPPSSFKDPSPKRPPLHSAAPSTNQDFPGFTKLPLSNPLPSPLRRTVSDPIYYSDNTANAPTHFFGFSGGQGSIFNPQLEESNAPAPGLYRAISDPTPAVADYQQVETTTPPRPPASKFSRTPRKRESPSTKRLNKMKERLKEMNQWWNQVLREGEEEDCGSEDQNTDKKNVKDETENEDEDDADEAVWVERKGEYLVVHFRCPCRQGYQILLRGNYCYYKLTSF